MASHHDQALNGDPDIWVGQNSSKPINFSGMNIYQIGELAFSFSFAPNCGGVKDALWQNMNATFLFGNLMALYKHVKPQTIGLSKLV